MWQKPLFLLTANSAMLGQNANISPASSSTRTATSSRDERRKKHHHSRCHFEGAKKKIQTDGVLFGRHQQQAHHHHRHHIHLSLHLPLADVLPRQATLAAHAEFRRPRRHVPERAEPPGLHELAAG